PFDPRPSYCATSVACGRGANLPCAKPKDSPGYTTRSPTGPTPDTREESRSFPERSRRGRRSAFPPTEAEIVKKPRGGPVPASRAGKVYRRRFVSTRLAATLLADGASCFAIWACPALVIKRDCS